MNADADMALWSPPRNDDEISFEDSEQFEEDSQASFDGSTDGINQNWRGWASCPSNGEAIQPGLSCVVYSYQYPTSGRFSSASTNTVVVQQHNTSRCEPLNDLLSLSEIAARVCAEKWSFQQLEEMYQQICASRLHHSDLAVVPSTTIPEKIFLAFIVHCFPQSTDEIRMYSTLANGNCEAYNTGNSLYQVGAVRDVSQTGFLLSANVLSTSHDIATMETTRQMGAKENDSYHVTVKVDRCRIVECTCECSSRSSWCQHVVALCIYRIHQRNNIKFNETIADAINSMSDFELRKLVQWHINEIPRKCIPGFQTLIDQIKDPNSEINQLGGAPDPTDGGHEPVSRYDFPEIQDKVRRLLCKYCVPSPTVHCDVQYLSTTQHPTTVEWHALIKPLRAKEPEGMWNLLQMVREMFARGDENAIALLRTITDECLSNTQVLLWWYITKLVQSGHWTQHHSCKMSTATQILAQYNCAQLCDEVVALWKCAAMNPRASRFYRSQLATYLQDYHRTTANRLRSVIGGGSVTGGVDSTVLSNHQTQIVINDVVNCEEQCLSALNMRFTVDWFPGFYPALQMCHFLCEKNINFGVPEDAYFDLEAPNFSQTVKMIPPKVKKSKKKKKKSSSSSSRRTHRRVDPLEGPSNHNFQEINGLWRVEPDLNRDNHYQQHHNNYPSPHHHQMEQNPAHHPNMLQDSTESGQESDVQSADPTAAAARRKKLDSMEMDVNEMLAAAFTPLDAIESRFVRCEAYATHGYRADAIEHALKLVDYLLDSLNEQADGLQPGRDEPSPVVSQDGKESVAEAIELDSEVVKANRFLATIEKILYITKVIGTSQHLHAKVFWIALKTLEITKYPLTTKYQQIRLYYYEAELIAILQNLVASIIITPTELAQVRDVARKLVATKAGTNGDMPPIMLAQFAFEMLYPVMMNNSDVELHPPRRGGPHQNGDAELALQVALNLLGCQHAFSDEQYPIASEATRRQKNDLALILLIKFKESSEKLGLVMDKILDPNLHRMYTNHASNAAYFLERCPVYLRYHKNRQRPIYPYVEVAEPQEDVVQQQQAAVEEEMKRMSVGKPAAPINRDRNSDDGMQSSSSSDTSPETANFSPQMPFGLTKNNATTLYNLHFKQSDRDPKDNGGKRKMKRRFMHALSPICSATEAHVYHMHELAKKVLAEAGGQQNNVFALGNVALGNTHRKLHLCSVIIAIYALGMNNRISPSWNTRTYSTSVSWINNQVLDIGPSALEMIRETWTSHFTPSEIANISDRASPAADPQMRKEAAKLALSVLPYAHSLNDEEVVSALEKCREDGREMLIAGLQAMDTAQFRHVARSKPWFTAMLHWLDLTVDEHQQHQQQPQQQPYHWGAIGYPSIRMAEANPGLYQQQLQYYAAAQQSAGPSTPQQYNMGGMIAPQQAQYLYPEAAARLHQSHSAPQLGGQHQQQQQHQQMQEEPPIGVAAAAEHHQMSFGMKSKISAYLCGIRALDSLATSPGEERQLYLKYGANPPYIDEITKLYHVAMQLGAHHLLTFYSTAARSVVSPYVLHQYAKDSTKFFPHRVYCPPPPPQQQQQGGGGAAPPPPIPPLMPPAPSYPQPQLRYPNVKFASPGMISGLFVQNGYHSITGELFERTCEQYLQAIINKMNNHRLSDTTEICSFLSNASDAFKCIPSAINRNLFDDFVRAFKKQKTFKKELANSINNLLNQLF